MAITRTAKGTAALKDTGTTLTLSDVSVDPGTLVVGIGFQGTAAPTGVAWGGRGFIRMGQRIDNTLNFGVSAWKIRIGKSTARTITATWAATPNARCMLASHLDATLDIDDIARSLSTATGAPSAGPTGTLSTTEDFAFGFHVSEGPANNDTAASSAGGGFSLGQRVGTNGVPPVSNVTIQETYLQTIASTALTSSLSGATARDWANIVVPMLPSATDSTALTILGRYYDALAIQNQAGDGPNALRVFLHGYYNNYALPATATAETLSILGLTQTEYGDAITLLENEGVIETLTGGSMTPIGIVD